LTHEVEIKDRRIAHVIKACQDLPGYNLFEYVDEAGDIRTITSQDVNEYLRSITGQEFSAKDFRTWAGTVQTALALVAIGNCNNATEAKHNVVAAVKDTAKRLGNRPATCRNYYVHPAVTEAYLDGTLSQFVKPVETNSTDTELTLYPEERGVLRLIQSHSTLTQKAA
jgi:DNA topoisomerase-1